MPKTVWAMGIHVHAISASIWDHAVGTRPNKAIVLLKSPAGLGHNRHDSVGEVPKIRQK